MQQQTARPRRLGPLAIAAIAAAAVTFIVFAPSLRNGFVDWDDQLLLTGNIRYRGLGPPNIAWMFTTFLGGLYQPLSWLTYGLDYSLWGMNPFGYHLTSLLLHAANAGLFALVCARLYRLASPEARYAEKDLALAAGFAALAFAIHPLRAESVCWATERRDVLSGLFLLLTVHWYLARELRLSAAAYAVSLLAKASGAMLPLMLLALDVWPLRRLGWDIRDWTADERRPVLKEKLPYFCLAAAAGLAGVYGQALASLMPLETHGLAARAAQFFYGLRFYFEATLAPRDLLPLYELPVPFDPLAPRFVISAAAVCAAGWALWKRREEYPAGLAALAWYALALLPVLGLFQFGQQLVADRYSYIACLSWAALAGGLLLRALQGEARVTSAAFSGVLLCALALLTFRQGAVWRDAETLWRYTLSKEPAHLVAHNNLGATLVEKGDWENGVALYREALELRPGYTLTRNNLGAALAQRGYRAEAEAQYREALALRPDYPDAHYNLANTLAAEGRRAEAEQEYIETLKLQPEHMQAHFNLGNIYKDSDRYAEAAAQYRAALAQAPDYAPAHFSLGTSLYLQGLPEQALPPLRRALELKPDYAQAAYNLATALAAMRLWDEAAAQYETALRLEPANADALVNLGNVRLMQGRAAEAAADYSAALALDPKNPLARNNLKTALAARRN